MCSQLDICIYSSDVTTQKHIIYLAWPTINNTVHVFMHRFSCDSIAAYIAVDLSCGIRSLFISIEMMHDGVVGLKWKMRIC